MPSPHLAQLKPALTKKIFHTTISRLEKVGSCLPNDRSFTVQNIDKVYVPDSSTDKTTCRDMTKFAFEFIFALSQFINLKLKLSLRLS